MAAPTGPTTTPEPSEGKPPSRRQQGKNKRLEKARSRRARARYAPVYDVQGPKVRLGVLWFLVIVGALVYGTPALAVVYGVTAMLAAYQLCQVWTEQGEHPNPLVATIGAASIPAAAVIGAAPAGVAVLATTVLALFGATTTEDSRDRFIAAAGTTVRCSVFVGLAAASPILAYEVHPGAGALLLLFVSAYETGDYLVGSGSANSFEGPIAGAAAIAVFGFAAWVANLPPFDRPVIPLLAGMAALLCPLGQIAGSALLPRADSPASAVRRLDSLLVLGPVWVAAVWSLID
jgi:hypothetical protein